MFYELFFLPNSFFIIPVCLIFFGKVMTPKEMVRGVEATLPSGIRLWRIWIFTKYKYLFAYEELFDNVILSIVFCDLHCKIFFQFFV